MADQSAAEEAQHQPKDCPVSCWEKTAEGWQNFWSYKIIQLSVLVLIPVGLHVSSLAADIALAIQYYRSGYIVWFAWTLGLVLGPLMIVHIWSCAFLYRATRTRSKDDSEFAKVVQDSPTAFRCLSSIPMVSVLSHYAVITLLIWRGRDVSGIEHDRNLPMIHLLESVMADIPHLCLQINITISTHPWVNVLKVVSMVMSLLATVKAVVTYLYYKSNLHRRKFTCGLAARLMFMIVWKLLEVSVRVLTMGLFASAFKPWIALRIGLHWLTMTVAYFVIDKKLKGFVGFCAWGLAMVVDTFSMTFSPDHKRTFWLNTMLTLLGNITMVTVWYTLKEGQDWYDAPALVGVVAGSVLSACCGFIGMVLNGRIESPVRTCSCCEDISETETPPRDSAAPNSGSPNSVTPVCLNAV